MRKLFTFLLLACFSLSFVHADDITFTKKWTKTYSWNTGSVSRDADYNDGKIYVIENIASPAMRVINAATGDEITGEKISNALFNSFSVTSDKDGALYVPSGNTGGGANFGLTKVTLPSTVASLVGNLGNAGGRSDFIEAYKVDANVTLIGAAMAVSPGTLRVWTVTDGVPSATPVTFTEVPTSTAGDVKFIDANKVLLTARGAGKPAILTLNMAASTYTKTDINVPANPTAGGSAYFKVYDVPYAIFDGGGDGKGQFKVYDISNPASPVQVAQETTNIGGTTNASYHVGFEAVVIEGATNTVVEIYAFSPNNGLTKHELTIPKPADPGVTKTFTVTVPQGTQNVYVVGSFPEKNWDATDPYQLTPTANPNEFKGTFPFHPAGALADAFEYKYLNGKDWDYGEATASLDIGMDGKPVAGANRTYNAADVVPFWVASPSVTLTASFASGINTPANLFVKGDWDAWDDGKAMTKSGDKFSVTINQKTFANTEYKYYSDDPSNGNWETRGDNRWAIYPGMTDEIAGFDVEIPEPVVVPDVVNLIFKKTDYAWNTGDHSRSAAYYDGYIYPIDKGGKKLHVLSVADGAEGTAIANDNFTGFGATADQAGNKYVTSGAWGMTGNLQGTLMLAGQSSVYANTTSATGGRIDFVSAYGNLKTNGYLAGATTNTADNIAVWSVTNGVINAASPIIISGKRVGTQNSGAENSGAEIVWMDANKVMATTADRSIAIVTLDYGTPENSTTQEIGGEFKLHAPVGGGAYFRTKTKEYIAVPKNQYGAIAVYNITNLGAPIQIGETTANVGSNANGALHVSVHASLAKVDDDVIATIYVWAPNNGLAVYKVNLGADLLVGVDNNTAKADYRIKRTATGIAVDLVETASIEVYTVNGVMIDRAVANGSYSRDLANGIYIIRINGQAVKFVR